MIPKGLFTQIAMVILSVAIIITYVQPEFAKVGKVQDSIGVYQTEREKVVSVNSQLSSFVSRLESVSLDDQRGLATYMPDMVDEIAVQRDLLFITIEAGVLYKSVGYVGKATFKKTAVTNESVSTKPVGHSFTLSVEGTYGQLKNLFKLIEQNNYPLEIYQISVQQIDGGFLSAQIQLVTYAHQKPVSANQIVF